MSSVLTLIADPVVERLDDSMLRLALGALEAVGADVDAADWLAPSTACDLAFGGVPADLAQAAVARALAGKRVDLVAQARSGRRKRILVADMESTIIRQEMLDEIGAEIGIGPRIAEITRRAMNGEIDFKGALRERVGLLAGVPVTLLETLKDRIELMPGAAALIATMKKHGAHTALVSGGFRLYTGFIRQRLGFDEDHANDLETADGRLTGRPVEPILDKDSKLAALIRIAGEQQVPLAETLTVGDGANDLPMLKAAGLGIAFRAKPVVAAEAHARIDHGDLTALLYAQGYRAAEILLR
jgi:phosphoserine phosphatase